MSWHYSRALVMGWPEGWTGLAPLVTDKWQSWLRRHGV
jgi:hypothetical protein